MLSVGVYLPCEYRPQCQAGSSSSLRDLLAQDEWSPTDWRSLSDDPLLRTFHRPSRQSFAFATPKQVRCYIVDGLSAVKQPRHAGQSRPHVPKSNEPFGCGPAIHSQAIGSIALVLIVIQHWASWIDAVQELCRHKSEHHRNKHRKSSQAGKANSPVSVR